MRVDMAVVNMSGNYSLKASLQQPLGKLHAEPVRLLCRSERLYAALIPLLLIAALLLSPIFLDLTMLRPLQLVFPPFLYLKAVYRTRWLLLQALQTAAYAVVVLVLSRRRR